MGNRRIILSFLLVLSVILPSHAQNGTASPLSSFGIGEVQLIDYGENIGLAGLGIGFRQVNSYYTSNPASLTTINRQYFVFDGVISAKYSDFSSKRAGASTFSGNIQRISAATRASKNWALGFGLMPYTHVGYNLLTKQYVEGYPLVEASSVFKGSGGLSKVFISNAYQYKQKLSVGINASLITGSINQIEKQSVWTIERSHNTNKIIFDAGVQYEDTIMKSLIATVGLVGGYGTKLQMHNNVFAYDNLGAVAVDKYLSASSYEIPSFLGVGFSVNSKYGWTAGVDYRFQRWSKVKSGSAAYKYQDVNKLTFGATYIPNVVNPLKYSELIQYQFGVVLSDSYIKYKDQNPYNYALTFGAIFPLRNSSNINFSIEYGCLGANSTISEDYIKLNLGITFRDIWYMRRQYD